MKSAKSNSENITRIFSVQRETNTVENQNKPIFGTQKEKTNSIENESFFHGDFSLNNEKKKKKKNRIHFTFRGTYKEGRWGSEEHQSFIKNCILFGNNWRKVIFNFFALK